MVSPSRKKKSLSRNTKSNNSNVKKECLKSQAGASPKITKRSSSENYKPLVDKKIYLNIKDRADSHRLETLFKKYGATIEVFLIESVNLVVSDHTDVNGSVNVHSPAASVSPLTATPSPVTYPDGRLTLPRSRTFAMLEKVTQKSSSATVSNPLDLALRWKITIITTEQAWKWLSKIKTNILKKISLKKAQRKENNLRILDEPFLKIEAIEEFSRPEVIELDTWPQLHFDGRLGQTPFRSPSPLSLENEQINEKFCKNDKVTVELINQSSPTAKFSGFVLHGKNTSTASSVSNQGSVVISSYLHKEIESKMTRRPANKNSNSDDDINTKHVAAISLCNGHNTRAITRQSSQELLKVQCNGLTTNNHRSFKLLSPSGSDVLPLPTSKQRSRRRASASWCGSTRELAQLSPTSSELSDGVRRSRGSLDNSDAAPPPTVTSAAATAAGGGGVTLRPKGQLWLPVALIGTTAEENGNNIRKRYEFCTKDKDDSRKTDSDSNDSLLKQDVDCCSDNSDCHVKQTFDKKETYCIVTRNKKENMKSEEGCVGKKKKLSREEKLLQDNKDYFNLEVLNTKLRSSDSLLNINQTNGQASQVELEKKTIDKIIIKKITVSRKTKSKKMWTKTNKKSEDGVTKPVNGVIKKKRKTELMKLCDEAENFMFGESSRQDSATSTASTVESDYDCEDKKKKWSCEDSSMESSLCSWEGGKPRKKRRSHAEAFIHDNLDYYKFEIPGSRLRYHGSFLDIKPDNEFVCSFKRSRGCAEEEVPVIKVEGGENVDRKSFVTPSEEVEKLTFLFETSPSTEVWFDVFKRQDEGLENYYQTISDPDDQMFLLPYELPGRCLSQQQQQQQQQPPPPPVHTPKQTTESDYYKKRRRRLAHLLANHPRKSPRCHASTLAILSSLTRRRRRSGTNISVTSPTAPTAIPNKQQVVDVAQVDKQLDEMLGLDMNQSGFSDDEQTLFEPCVIVESDKVVKVKSRRMTRQESRAEAEADELNLCDDKHFLQTLPPDSFSNVINKHKKSGPLVNVLKLIEEYKYCRSMVEQDEELLSECDTNSLLGFNDLQDVKTLRKKRKFRRVNRTGWDKKVRKKLFVNKLNKLVTKEIEKCPKKEGKVKDVGSEVVLRSRVTDSETRSLTDSLEYSPCVVRVRKMKEPVQQVRDKVEKIKLLHRHRKKRKRDDFSWTTDRRKKKKS